ncbi:MAG: 1-acyl-sn-glycerol-3-phosphate acyltransferase [Pseudomonadales bacterium]|nr:1-acyl-sn-glycerol-3-phosphate acyltransferase [Pseudomonadales bacterium]
MSSYVQDNQTPQFVRRPFTIYKWIFVAPFLALTTVLLTIPIVILSFLGAGNFSSRVIAKAWARINTAAAMIKVEVVGKERINPDQSYIIVANHQSLTDIYALYGFLDSDVKWVMKKELRAIPVFGHAAAAMGHIIIDRSDTKSAVQTINDAREKIHGGMSVIFFPEGTRSNPGELRKFKKGAFRFAVELGLPILPVALHGTANILPSNTIDLMPGKIKLEYCDPIPTAGMDIIEVGNLADQARKSIYQALHKTDL